MNRFEKGNGPFLVNRRSRLQAAGFTLIEMAVVIFIIGLIASMSMAAINARLINASIQATKINQDTIKDALVAYLGRYRRLPCPDTDFTAPDGIENRTTAGSVTTPCSAPFGLVPYQTLGLTKSVALDGWDNFFSYQISNSTTPHPNTDWTITNSFHEGNTGVITVNDRSSSPMLNIVAVIISHGKDGLGAYTFKGTQNTLPDQTTQPDEYQNAVPTTTPNVFYKREYTDSKTAPGGTFDDVVMILNPNDLLTPLIKDGVIQSPLGAYVTQVSKIQDWIASYIASNNCAVPIATTLISNIPTNLTIDPWGNTLNATGSPFTYLRGGYSGTIYTDIPTYSSSANAASTIYTLGNTTTSIQVPGSAPIGNNLLTAYKYLFTLCP